MGPPLRAQLFEYPLKQASETSLHVIAPLPDQCWAKKILVGSLLPRCEAQRRHRVFAQLGLTALGWLWAAHLYCCKCGVPCHRKGNPPPPPMHTSMANQCHLLPDIPPENQFLCAQALLPYDQDSYSKSFVFKHPLNLSQTTEIKTDKGPQECKQHTGNPNPCSIILFQKHYSIPRW